MTTGTLRATLRNPDMVRIAAIALRLTLAAGFLSAVADRLGLWGPPGTPMVAWGNMTNFFGYTAKLNPWCPRSVVPVLGWTVTTLESVLGIALLAAFQLPLIALSTGLLTTLFAIAMSCALGVHEPLNYSVFTFSASAYLLAAVSKTSPRSNADSDGKLLAH